MAGTDADSDDEPYADFRIGRYRIRMYAVSLWSLGMLAIPPLILYAIALYVKTPVVIALVYAAAFSLVMRLLH